MNSRRAIMGFLLSFVFLSSSAYIISGLKWAFDNIPQSQTASVSKGVENILSNMQTQDSQPVLRIEEPEIDALSAISVETDLNGNSKSFFEKNTNIPLPIASLTKLMTAIIVLDNYNLSDKIVIDAVADSQDSLKKDLKLGDNMSTESLLDIMIVGSSNKAAYALSEGPGGRIGPDRFIGLMNQKAKDIGLVKTVFLDPTGLSPQNVSTARDLVKLASYILENPKYKKIVEVSGEKEVNIQGLGVVANTDQLLGEIPEIICSKTGFTTAAKGCLLLITRNQKNNDYLINVILGADDRFLEMKKLINWSSQICN